jgi:hypothetical protein
MVFATNVALIASLALASSAFRVRPKKRPNSAPPVAAVSKASDVTPPQAVKPRAEALFQSPAEEVAAEAVGEPGQVNFVFTFGAPGGGSPGLQNQRGSNPCFPGYRVYNSKKGRLWSEYVDLVARIGNLVFYWHPWMHTVKVNERDPEWDQKDCSYEQSRKPSVIYTLVSLHGKEKYIDGMAKSRSYGDWYHNVSIFASRKSYIQEADSVYHSVKQYGWRLAGSALHPGGSVYGGQQVSHLIQRPSNLECVLTFQGTASIQGWVANFHFEAKHFCGLVDQDESCFMSLGTCKTRHPRGSFVHGGFKDRVLSMIKGSDFQQNIRPQLPRCSSLSVVGHSLGGAVAELFAACASKAPQPGQYGYEDYKYMAWTKEAPAKLAWIE